MTASMILEHLSLVVAALIFAVLVVFPLASSATFILLPGRSSSEWWT